MNEALPQDLADDLRTKLEAGRPVLLVARNSGQDKKARRQCAEEMKKAAESLFSKSGIDLRSDLPSQAALTQALDQAQSESIPAEAGRDLIYRWAVLTPRAGVVLLLTTGSGRKLDTSGQQPAALRVANEIRRFKPALVFAHRADRMTRHMLSAPHILSACSHVGSWLGDSEHSVNPVTNLDALLNLFATSAGEAEANKIPVATRKGMAAKTDREMINGRMRYACTGAPPPGLARMALRNSLGTRGDTIVTLDAPDYFPPESEVLVGYPNVKCDGTAVDQVSLVKWALSHLGKPGYTHDTVGSYLAQNHFSTASLRRLHGPSADFHNVKPASRALRPILENLDFYRTGIFVARFGVSDVPDFEIKNCAPEGGWATDEDIERIRAYLRNGQGPKHARLSFVGVPVRSKHGPLVLRTAEHDRRRGVPSYKLMSIHRGYGLNRALQMPTLPHAAVAESIVTALTEASEKIWIPLADHHDDTDKLAKLRKLRFELDEADKGIQVRERDMIMRGGDGELVLPPTAIRQIAEEVQGLQDTTHSLRQRIREIEEEIQVPDRNDIDKLLSFVASLRNPEDMTYREFWQQNLCLTNVERFSEKKNGLDRLVVRWEGTLRLEQLGVRFDLHFTGSHAVGAYEEALVRVRDIIEQVIDGKGPLDEVSMANPRAMRSLIAESLGFDTRHFAIGGCPDALIQAIGFAIRLRPEASDDSVATDVGVDPRLVHHMRGILQDAPLSWFRRANRGVEEFSRSIAKGQYEYGTADATDKVEWDYIRDAIKRSDLAPSIEFTFGKMRVRPCATCRSQRRLIPRIYGLQGLVCWECMTDGGGIQWSDSYRGYLIGADMLGVAEFQVADRKSGGTSSRSRYGSRSRGDDA